ncbi:compound eye opsin BCRH2-like [Tigriopus californicus]|uniref:compound eye opsin BCRH2-like n=1 Tax=Tigriopus californicus TaxID=6832 RepID=UPI0027DA47E2|nr:compound eye opsin BCRH2-like [Tigriopus californicus]
MGTPLIYLDQSYTLHYPPGTKHTDGASEDVLAITHEHWTQYPPVHPFIQHTFGLLFFVLWFISVTGNGLVIFIFLKTKTLRTPSNMLVVALAFSDFVMIWSQAPPLFINVFMSKHWAFGPLACELYGFLGGVFGCGSLWMIIMIGYDRYNVIVKGFNGMKITPCIAFLMIVFSFAYSTALCILPLLKVWGSYKLEGLLLTCSFDYLTDDWINKSFTLFFFLGCFGLPMCFIIYFYSQIVYAVVAHERALKAQAKKMNVESLRSNTDANAESAEVRIAKVAITNICLWLLAWTPYAAIAMIGQFGGAHLLTPVVTQLPSFLAKTASCFNPIVYAVSHPKYREALTKELPCLGIREESQSNENKTTAETTG